MSLEVAVRHPAGAIDLDVEFRLDEPGVTVLFGPSGAGKSTLLGVVAGLIRPAAGRIALSGRTVLDTEQGLCEPPHKRGVGMVFQEARLFPHLTVRANVAFGAARRGGVDEAELGRIAQLLNIAPLLDRGPARLSGGERQRVALGRALLSRPQMLLLDEPLAALDAARKAEILPYLERLRDAARIPMLYVTHAVDEAMRLADQVLVMEEGKVTASGPVFDVMSRLDVAAATARADAGAVLEARVQAQDTGDHLTELTFSGGVLVIPAVAAAVGEPVRVRIEARDITLALDPPGRVSANNVLPAEVTAIREGADGHADVALRCGEARLLARVTRRSLRRLALHEGAAVYALVKSVTVDRRPAGPPSQQIERPSE